MTLPAHSDGCGREREKERGDSAGQVRRVPGVTVTQDGTVHQRLHSLGVDTLPTNDLPGRPTDGPLVMRPDVQRRPTAVHTQGQNGKLEKVALAS